MIFWLDWLLFGNGRGMQSPYYDDVFYWLKDTTIERAKAKGRFYRFSGWFGCQLAAVEWRAPPVGTRRFLAGREFVLLRATRKFLRVETSWTMVSLKGVPIDEANERIRELRDNLGRSELGNP